MADSDGPTTPRSVKRGKQKEGLPEGSRELSPTALQSLNGYGPFAFHRPAADNDNAASPASRFRVPSGGFGSGLNKVPAPVITNQKYQSRHELVKPVLVEEGSVMLPPISEQMARQSFSDARASMSNGKQSFDGNSPSSGRLIQPLLIVIAIIYQGHNTCVRLEALSRLPFAHELMFKTR